MKITVIGAGIMGLSAAWALQRQGQEVTVYEQKQIPNCIGSSVDQHRLIRFPYGDQLGYAPMVFDAYEAWDQLWRDLGTKLYIPTGTLFLGGGTTDNSWMHLSSVTLEKLSVPVHWLDANQLKHNFPLFSFDNHEKALYLDSGGVLLADKIIEALSKYLSSRGVVFHSQTKVSKIDTDSGRTVLNNGETIDADMVIVAAGAWISQLLPEFAERVTPSRQLVAYIEPPNSLTSQWNDMPMIIDTNPSDGFYLVPSVSETQIKVGSNNLSMTGNPNSERVASETEILATYDLCRQRLKDFSQYNLKDAKICFCTVSHHKRFIIEPQGKAWVMTGFSGHGFKFAPLLGLALAQAATDCRHNNGFSKWAAGKLSRTLS